MTAIALDPRVEAFLAARQTKLLINGAWVDAHTSSLSPSGRASADSGSMEA